MDREIKGGDVVIVGGGVIGCAVARELARRGAAVVVLERGRPGGGATWAAAGMLTPQGEGRVDGSFLRLCLASLDLYPEFAASVHGETGHDPAFRPMGTLVAALSPDEAEGLRGELAEHRSRGGAVEWLDGAAALDREPALAPGVVGALWFPREGQVDNRALGRALWSAAVGAGASVACDSEARSLLVRGSQVAGVRLADGRTVSGDCVVLAAGAWSGQLEGLPRALPVRPVRGQMLALDAVPPVLSCLVSAAHVYLVPRSQGRVLVGATLEDAGFVSRTTARGVRGLLDGALRAVPSLEDAALAETWAGLRPGTPDGRPILGPDPAVDGLVYATGHFRNGILLTPVTAQLVADLIDGAPPGHDLSPYRVDRF